MVAFSSQKGTMMAPRRLLPAVSIAAVAAMLMLASPASAYRGEYKYFSLAESGDLAYLAANTTGNGYEPFVTDGTREGSHLVKDLVPGLRSSLAELVPRFTRVGNRTVFVGAAPAGGQHLWSTAGTSATTSQLTGKSTFTSANGAYPYGLTAFDDLVYFSVNSPVAKYGRVLWKTDGTRAGTGPVAGLLGKKVGSGYAGSDPRNFVVSGDNLYFEAKSATSASGYDIWVTDGTTAKIALPYSTASRDGRRGALVSFNGGVAYAVYGSSGESARLWVLDAAGSAPRAVTGDLALNGFPVAFDGALYYSALEGKKLRPLFRVLANADPVAAPQRISDLTVLGGPTVLDGTLWFTTEDPAAERNLLWVVDSSSALPRSIASSSNSPLERPLDSAIFRDGKVYFWNEGALWTSDGSEAGTAPLVSFLVARASTVDLAFAGDAVAVTLIDKFGTAAFWLTDGTVAGTSRVLPASTIYPVSGPTWRGTAKVGSTVEGLVKIWKPGNLSFSYQWNANGTPIAGATSKKYTLTSAESGKKITFSVTAARIGYVSVTKTSLKLATVKPA